MANSQKSKTLTLNVDMETLAEITTHQATLVKQTGVKISLSAVAASLLRKGLSATSNAA